MLGLANPFETFKKHQKTLIATPSKFEIRTVEEPKRGRGRPRKDTSLDQDPGAKTGIRDKLANAKLGIDDASVKKVGRPSKNPELMEKSKKINKAQVRKMKEAILKAKRMAKIQKRKQKEQLMKEMKK